MLQLKYRGRWQVASLFILASVMTLALVPELWPLPGEFFGGWRDPDKALHALTFAVLALWFSGQYARQRYWAIVSGLLIFGGVIEAIQYFIPYRSADSGDLLADIAGIVCGMVVALLGMGGWSLRIEQWIQNRIV